MHYLWNEAHNQTYVHRMLRLFRRSQHLQHTFNTLDTTLESNPDTQTNENFVKKKKLDLFNVL